MSLLIVRRVKYKKVSVYLYLNLSSLVVSNIIINLVSSCLDGFISSTDWYNISNCRFVRASSLLCRVIHYYYVRLLIRVLVSINLII